MPAAVERALRDLDRHGGGRGEALDRPGLSLPFRHLVERELGLLDLLAGVSVLAGVQRVFNQFPPDMNKLYHQREVVYLRRACPPAQHRPAIAGPIAPITDPTPL